MWEKGEEHYPQTPFFRSTKSLSFLKPPQKTTPKSAPQLSKNSKSSSRSSKKSVTLPTPSIPLYLSHSMATYEPTYLSLDHIINFQKQKVMRGRVITGNRGPNMPILLTKIALQGWSYLFPQGTIQRKLTKKKVTKFYINGKFDGTMFTSTILGDPIKLTRTDVARIIDVPSEGWSCYVNYKWLSLHNLPSALEVTGKLSGVPTLTHHHRVEKREIPPLHQLHFDVVHKIIL